jgi:creatinine amidohydrolase
MRYEMMLPHEIRRAIDEDWPVVLPLGVLEYHGEHLAVGLDTLVVGKVFERLEAETPMVILPPFYYGASSYAVAPPERHGSVHVDPEGLSPFALQLFRSLLRIGFRRVYGVVHHQTENFRLGMPTDLSFRLAARRAVFEFLESHNGEGWWGREDAATYYDEHEAGRSPFDWIRIEPLMNEQLQQQYPFDHAGIGETSLLMALAPQGVDLSRLDDETWYTQSARDASEEEGRRGVDLILDSWRRQLQPPPETCS